MKEATKHKLDRKTIYSGFVLQLLFIMFVVEFVKGALLITFLPLYMVDVLGVSGLVIGWTLAVQYLGDNLLRTPIGWVIDSIGYRTSMLTGVMLTLLSVCIIANSTSYYWIIVACILLGVGTAPLWPCVIIGTTGIAGEKARGTIMSVVYMAWLSGVGLGPFVITYFIDGANYTLAFRILICLMAAVVLVALFLPGKKRTEADKETPEPSGKRTPKGPYPISSSRMERMKLYMKEVWQSLRVSPLLYPAMFAQTFSLGLLTPVLTLYATKVLVLSNAQFRVFLLAGGLVTVVCMIPVGKLVDRWGGKWFLNIGLLLGSITLIRFTFVHSLPELYAWVVLLGIGYALIIPSWNAMIAAVIPPEKRGMVWGFFLTIEGLGTTIGPIVSGKLWDDLGPHGPFIASGAVLFVLLIVQRFISLEKKVVVR